MKLQTTGKPIQMIRYACFLCMNTYDHIQAPIRSDYTPLYLVSGVHSDVRGGGQGGAGNAGNDRQTFGLLTWRRPLDLC